MSRSYSIANAPHGDGQIELHLRRVAGGRFTDWAFDEMQVDEILRARAAWGVHHALSAGCAAFVRGGWHRVRADPRACGTAGPVSARARHGADLGDARGSAVLRAR
ncbi:FAD-binding oxidoreductase [Thiohalophilus sp.]|uniref:FAD-binding oxidoreductase n=1 Tax=Thiohalophilus sp. TaxID=3028392 RepID=UPI003A0FECBB